MTTITGLLSDKMTITPQAQALGYTLHVGEHAIDLNARRGQMITLAFSGRIVCLNCNIPTEKSYNQGYCATCAATLAKCDMCILKPEQCHYSEGMCREPSWGEANCLQDHIVYLSYTSGYKVGITRESKLATRWADQGALKATPLFRVSQRLYAGLIEQAFTDFVADKTNWRTMLISDAAPSDADLVAEAERVCALAQAAVDQLQLRFGEHAIERIAPAITHLTYPIGARPMPKIGMTHNLDKNPTLSGVLHGIKGQYAFIGNAVINLRKYSGYEITVS